MFRLVPLSLMVLAASALPASAQPGGDLTYDNNFNQWLVYSGDHAVSGKWGVHLEGQWRRNEFTRPQQLLLRPAVNYQLTDNVILTAGYVWVSTHRAGDFPPAVPFNENRLFEQVIINHRAKRLNLQHRFRLEQRWVDRRAVTPEGERVTLDQNYSNRARYMLRLTSPIHDDWYFATYNQLFINMAPLRGQHAFGQNRAFAGIGFELYKDSRLEFGYMQQTVLQGNRQIVELNHTGIHVSIYSNLPFMN